MCCPNEGYGVDGDWANTCLGLCFLVKLLSVRGSLLPTSVVLDAARLRNYSRCALIWVSCEVLGAEPGSSHEPG